LRVVVLLAADGLGHWFGRPWGQDWEERKTRDIISKELGR
jgi:hypothetical protein